MTCPICAKDTEKSYRPFCSKRCADRDLGRWLSDGYRVETEEVPDGTEATEPPNSWQQ